MLDKEAALPDVVFVNQSTEPIQYQGLVDARMCCTYKEDRCGGEIDVDEMVNTVLLSFRGVVQL